MPSAKPPGSGATPKSIGLKALEIKKISLPEHISSYLCISITNATN
jgi:hypothetical protein